MDSPGADWSPESELELQEMLLGLASSDEFKKNTRIMKEMINDVISKVNKPLSKGEVLWRLMMQLDLDVGRDCSRIFAIGTHVAWPTRWVVMKNEKPQRKKSIAKRSNPVLPSNVPRSLHLLYCYSMCVLDSPEKTISIIFYHDFFDH
ncbi:uncharacterized protein LOC122048282 [Zingiber officinale]|uniref:uncharacterized protein LOC122048282 n=1 Tax=Zingiber officinale TaxID=94328 RepID=UPI001C4AAF58|nr:uncharacterized protein LOC122048282 [Zingiber officinale]